MRTHVAVFEVKRERFSHEFQLNVVSRLVLLDQARFQQQRPDFTGCSQKIHALRFCQHRRFFRRTQVRHDARSKIDALADIDRGFCAVAENIDAGFGRQCVETGAVDVGRIVEVHRRRRQDQTYGSNSRTHEDDVEDEPRESNKDGIA